jgi:hypothetical protein
VKPYLLDSEEAKWRARQAEALYFCGFSARKAIEAVRELAKKVREVSRK